MTTMAIGAGTTMLLEKKDWRSVNVIAVVNLTGLKVQTQERTGTTSHAVSAEAFNVSA